MIAWIRLVGPDRAVEIFGVKLVGVDAANGRKLLFSVVGVALLMLLGFVLKTAARLAFGGSVGETAGRRERVVFWIRQGIRICVAVLTLLLLVSIWFDQPARLATAFGLVTAGLAFALQRVVTAFAGYMLILRGKTFNVGDRITMGGVRGDVIALGFLQTTIMEMGEPPGVQGAPPAMWVQARQYTGRIVTVTNDSVFDQPIYNYTREFPYLWEEMTIPITYQADRAAAERILLDAATRHSVKATELGEPALAEMERRYLMKRVDLRPRVYWRMTDNWLELTVRFITLDHGIRETKDAMTRDVLAGLDAAGIGIASATYDVVGFPPLRIERDKRPRDK